MRKLVEVPIQGSSGSLVPFLAGEVTADTFTTKAIEFLRRSGRANGEHPVVKRGDPRFDAWIAFRHKLGMKIEAAKRSEALTVPTDWPSDFSLDAAAPNARRERADVDG